MNTHPPVKPRHPHWDAAVNTTEQADRVFFVEGPASNWVILREGDRFTLVDGGYPADLPLVLESIRHVGLRPENAAALLITHGHTDHTGAALHFSAEYGTPVLSSAAEHRHLLGEEKFQVTLPAVLSHAWRPRVLLWAVHAIRAGGLADNRIDAAAVWDEHLLQELPGRPVAVPTPGHTPGHAAFHLPQLGVLITGDALVTGHAVSSREGPQMLHPMFHHSVPDAYRALDRLAPLAASVILPGHGPALSGNLAAMIPALTR